MKKYIALLGLFTVGAFLTAGPAQAVTASSFVIPTGTTSGTAQTLTTSETGTVNGTLSVSGSTVAITVTGSATIVNNGTIKQTGMGRDIRDNTGGLTLTVTNTAGALIQSADADVIQMNVSTSNVTFYNSGTLTSLNASKGGSQAIDFNAITTGSNAFYNYATGIAQATDADAVRPGVNGFVYNDGLIKSTQTTTTGDDGVDAQTNSGITIVNATTGTDVVTGTGTIEGARHGITGGNTNTGTDGTYIMSITNNLGGTIQGDDGSGVNIDGFSAKEVVTIVNHGMIIGNGVTADGDGVDVDGIVNLTNSGTIKSTKANNDTSEGVTVGGGTIINTGTIEGDNINGGLGRGITLAGLDKDPTTGNPIPTEGIFANTVITNSGLIKGQTDSGLSVTGAANSFTIMINNMAGGTIEGDGATAVALQMGGNNDTVNNYGTIKDTVSGMAIDLGAGTNVLNILGGSASVLGDISGGTGGTSSMVIDPGTGNGFSYAGAISNFSSGVQVKSGTVNLTGASTYSGGTTISGGTLQANNTTGSATGSGNVQVNAGGVLSGSGIIAPSAGNGITIASGGLLAPGFDPLGVASGVMSLTSSGGAPVLTFTAPVSPSSPAQLSFDLGASVNPATSVGAGTILAGGEHLVGSSTYIQLTVDAAGEVVFSNGANPTLISLDLLNHGNTVLGDYLLFSGGANTDYSNLTIDPTTGQITAGLSLIPTNSYSGELFLDHGDIYVDMKAVPEPSTWAMLATGLAFLGFRYYRSRRASTIKVG